jgi:hypothetical protein
VYLALIARELRCIFNKESGTLKQIQFQNKKLAAEKLPAVAAIASAATVPASISTSISTPTASTASRTTIAAAATAATRALGLRTRFIDDKVSAAEILPVKTGDRTLSLFIVGDFDERKTARLTGETVTNQTDCRRIHTSLSEPVL